MSLSSVAAVVLAAGAGRRFTESLPAESQTTAQHKLLVQFRGVPLCLWSVKAALSAGFEQVYVVTGAVDLSAALSSVMNAITLLNNPLWADGQATSLTLALKRAGADGYKAVVVGLADQPMVPESAWRAVGTATGAVVSASFDGQRRPPVKLACSVWPLLAQSGDEGARTLFRSQPELVSEVPCEGMASDIDTLEDLKRWS